MRRTAIDLEDVAERDHLGWAFWRAARGKRDQPEQEIKAEHEEDKRD